MDPDVPGRPTTCDRCGCQPITKPTGRYCPAGGDCIGLSESSDDGKVRRLVTSPALAPLKTKAALASHVPKMGEGVSKPDGVQ